MARQHVASEPMHLTSEPHPNGYAPHLRQFDYPDYRYTVQLCRRCGMLLGVTEGFLGRFPAGAVVEEGDLYLAMALHDRAVPECEAMK